MLIYYVLNPDHTVGKAYKTQDGAERRAEELSKERVGQTFRVVKIVTSFKA